MGDGRKGDHGLRYHLYMIRKDVGLNDAATLEYAGSMKHELQNKPGAFPGGAVLTYMSD